jgi:uncharacterized membrane protein
LRSFRSNEESLLSGNKVKALTNLKQAKTTSRSIKVALISVSAALYAAAIAVTSFIPTPWGVGNFRPGVVVPAFFAVACGPLVGGVGAAIGCFIGDLALSVFGLTNPLLSLIAGVPSNFVGFYLLGWLVLKHRSWASFIASSFVALIVGNLIAALGVVSFYSFIVPDWASWPVDLKIATVMGLTFFWVATMAPFVIPLTPILVKRTKPMLSQIEMDTGISKMSWGKPISLLRSSVAVAVVLVALCVMAEYTPWGSLLFSTSWAAFSTFWLKMLLLIPAGVVLAFGVIVTLILIRREKSVS